MESQQFFDSPPTNNTVGSGCDSFSFSIVIIISKVSTLGRLRTLAVWKQQTMQLNSNDA